MIYVGIDPDVNKSGFAVWNSNQKKLELFGSKNFFDMIELLINSMEYKIIIEAGWLNKKSNFHNSKNQTKQAGERIAKNVGANHQIGKLFEEFCFKHSIQYQLVKPKSKKTEPDIFKKITGLDVKNQDIIDSIMLVWGL